jgi:zinc transport system ATP-binding protein
MLNKILEVKNLNVDLGGERVIEDLTFNVSEKEILVILGPNGAGKSVLLRTLLGLHPFKGEISWKKNIHIGYVPDDFGVPPDLPLNVREFFGFKKAASFKIHQSFEWVGMNISPKFLEKKLGTLSSGQLRRTLIAWSLVDEPDSVLLDEPMVGIDIQGREVICDSLVNLWKGQGQTIILVSHEIGEVCKRADKILALNKRKLFYGLPKEVITPENLTKIYGSSVSI